MSNVLKLLEGKYNFYDKGSLYCEETFEIFRKLEDQSPNFILKAETISRVRTGEFLIINTIFESTPNFDPLFVKVQRSLGERKSIETYVIEPTDKILNYFYDSKIDNNSSTKSNQETKQLTGKFHITTPAFSSISCMLQNRRIDQIQRTPYSLITSSNIWSYEGSLGEDQIFMELINTKPQTITIGSSEKEAMHAAMFQGDKSLKENERTDYYLSKHYQLPYKAEYESGIVVEIDKLKITEVKMKL